MSRASTNPPSFQPTPNLGHCFFEYLNMQKFLDEKSRKLKIPHGISQIKLDVGLSFGAPIAAEWLNKLPDRVVFGFEPNPENVYEILTGINKKRGVKFKYLNPKYINKRFFLYDVAIDVGQPRMKTFYMTQGDPGTSSLYEPHRFRIKRVIQVPCIPLSAFLQIIPWSRFKYIEHLKVDTQGNDLRVLQSAGEYLPRQIVFVTAEISAFNQYSYSHSEKELDGFMRKNGFKFIPGTRTDGNKSYLNQKYERLSQNLDCSIALPVKGL